VKKLTEAQKLELLQTIRYSYLEHKQLLSLLKDPTFVLAKDYVRSITILQIIQGLSMRLKQYEGLQDEHKIDIEYVASITRDSLRPRTQYTKEPGPDDQFPQVEEPVVPLRPDLRSPPRYAPPKTLAEHEYDQGTALAQSTPNVIESSSR
jgi:hypothetical protein